MNFFLLLLIFLNIKSNASEIKGIVTDGSNPKAFARVSIKGQSEFVFTKFDGTFLLENIQTDDSLIIAAWAEGFYNSEVHAAKGDSNIIITLHSLPSEDNKNYKWLLPFADEANTNNCGNCHTSVIVDQWQNNAHGNSAKINFSTQCIMEQISKAIQPAPDLKLIFLNQTATVHCVIFQQLRLKL